MVKPEFDLSKFRFSTYFLIRLTEVDYRILVNVKGTPTNERQQQSGTARKGPRGSLPARPAGVGMCALGRQLWLPNLPLPAQCSSDLHVQTWLADLMLSNTLPASDSGQLQRLLWKGLHRVEKRVCRARWRASKMRSPAGTALGPHLHALGCVHWGSGKAVLPLHLHPRSSLKQN